MTITKQGYTTIVLEYQLTKKDTHLEEMWEYLHTFISQSVNKQLQRVKVFGYAKDEVESLALETLWLTMNSYDGSKGADFLAYYSQRLQWIVNDKLIEAKNSLADDRYFNSVSLDTPPPSHSGEDMDGETVLGQSDLFLTTDQSLGKVDYIETFPKLLTLYLHTSDEHPAHIGEGIKLDVEILKEVLHAVDDNRISKKEINEHLYRAFPDVAKDTLRLRKKNAIKRFGKFLLENL